LVAVVKIINLGERKKTLLYQSIMSV